MAQNRCIDVFKVRNTVIIITPQTMLDDLNHMNIQANRFFDYEFDGKISFHESSGFIHEKNSPLQHLETLLYRRGTEFDLDNFETRFDFFIYYLSYYRNSLSVLERTISEAESPWYVEEFSSYVSEVNGIYKKYSAFQEGSISWTK